MSASPADVRADAGIDCVAGLSFWRRIVSPHSQEYCALMLSAQVRLEQYPKASAQAAARALELIADDSAAQLILAQSLLYQGNVAASQRVFSSLFGQPEQSVRRQLLSFQVRSNAARAALLSADYISALSHYRRAVVQASDSSSSRQRVRIMMEAAASAHYASPQGGREARGYLRLARKQTAPLLKELINASMALSLWREGREEEAIAWAAPVGDSWKIRWIFENSPPSVGRKNEVLPLLPPGERAALAAVVAEAVEPSAASLHWDEFFELGAGVVPEHLLVRHFVKKP